MKNFVKNVFNQSAAAAGMPIKDTPLPLHYTLSAFRWHLDSRPPSKIVAVHDFLSSNAYMQQLLHEPTADLPLSRLSPTDPIEIYSVDLRGHSFSHMLPSTSDHYALLCAADVALLQREVLVAKAKLCGVGFGAMVAMCAALHAPQQFDGVTLFVQSFDQLFSFDPQSYAMANVIKSLPANLASAREVNDFLKDQSLSAVDRALLLSTLEMRDGRAKFRFSDDVLGLQQKVNLGEAELGSAVFDHPVAVYVCSEKPVVKEQHQLFLRAFPQER
ncbi:hypothetical protein STCU_07513 [Strigomonas culicis]|uniref:AB hydrolase-1 domain-containing protein n=1 Tax=Strigomonas culicis TaxID=28005 RepID=S9TYX7_9TRYP|nr:hypothetical protein STCU_07513 [Strigomonas culicis]|eukprot:EPY23727.1 hypothetical protein STCU_07513 [Strigomonas culicis]